MQKFPCDICGSDDPLDIPCLIHYGLQGQIVVCRTCGFVYVPKRRSEQEIADSWSNEIFGAGYTSDVPYVQARLFWVAQEIASRIRLQDATLVDVGCGEGLFLDFIKRLQSDIRLIGVDPSEANVARLRSSGFEAVLGTAQQAANDSELNSAADIVTLTWTLENSNDCRSVLAACTEFLKDDGLLVVATGSRILVPFKKPLGSYLTSSRPADTHCFRWSYRSLTNLLRQEGFTPVWHNHFIDSDWMLVMARKSKSMSSSSDVSLPSRDDAYAVVDFFEEWHAFSQRLIKWDAPH
jgi:2-polyprenyl-3-methyl-5-hydroxy-6-metoxy-1,4-benzoquinol methylase